MHVVALRVSLRDGLVEEVHQNPEQRVTQSGYVKAVWPVLGGPGANLVLIVMLTSNTVGRETDENRRFREQVRGGSIRARAATSGRETAEIRRVREQVRGRRFMDVATTHVAAI